MRFCEAFDPSGVCQIVGPARHPSQLYEAALEGILLFVVLAWMFWRTRARYQPGKLVGTFILVYGLSRFLVEFIREPDSHLVEFASRTGLHMGQWLSVPMILGGLYLVLTAKRREARVGRCRRRQPAEDSPPMSPLEEQLRARIAARGADQRRRLYGGLQRALLRDPRSARRGGDFITAPEISQMFGELVGAWLADLWQRAGRPADARLCRAGARARHAGRGRAAGDGEGGAGAAGSSRRDQPGAARGAARAAARRGLA